MYYGKDKTRQMVRSILPSTARKGARDAKRTLHKKNRAELAQKLTHLKGDADDVIEEWEYGYDDLEHCWTPRYMPGYDVIVFDRRGSDKLNHFEHWAERITASMDPDDRMDYMRSLLPPGMIGDHALSHLRWMDPQWERQSEWRRNFYNTKEAIARQNKRDFYQAICDKVNAQIEEAIEHMMITPQILKKWNHAMDHFTWLEEERYRRAAKRMQEWSSPPEKPAVFVHWTKDNYWKFMKNAHLSFSLNDGRRFNRYSKLIEDESGTPCYNYGYWCKFVCEWFNIELPEQIK